MDDREISDNENLNYSKGAHSRDIPTSPMYKENMYGNSQSWDRPIGPEVEPPKAKDGRYYKPVTSKHGKVYYPGMKRQEDGSWIRPERRQREYGPRITDEVPSYDIVGDFRDARANITFGQLVNENPRYHSKLRQGTYRPSAINKKD